MGFLLAMWSIASSPVSDSSLTMNRLSTLCEGFLLVFFTALISCLTVYGALGVDPSTINQPSALREATAAHRQ